MQEKVENLQLYKVKDGVVITGDILDDNMTLAEAGYNSSTARAQQPAVIAVAFRESGKKHFSTFNCYRHTFFISTCLNLAFLDGKFVPKMDPVSDPPPLPDVMRSGQTESAGSSSQKHEEQAI